MTFALVIITLSNHYTALKHCTIDSSKIAKLLNDNPRTGISVAAVGLHFESSAVDCTRQHWDMKTAYDDDEDGDDALGHDVEDHRMLLDKVDILKSITQTNMVKG